MLKKLANNENKIGYKKLSSSGKFYEVNFFKKYGFLYGLLKDLLTRRMTLKDAIDAQINFVNDLMRGYNEMDLNKELLADFKKYKSASKSLSITNRVFLETERNPNKEIQSFFQKNLKHLF